MACTLYSRSIGWVPVDVFVKETTKDSVEIAKHPVEAGTLISDHAWINPREITISGIITGGSMAGYEALHQLQTTLEPFDIISGFSIYSNMLLQNLTATREKSSGQICAFDATCRQVIIVSSEQSDTSDNDRASNTVQRGTVQARNLPSSTHVFRGSKEGAKAIQ